jgi:hypothetical protein
VNLYGTALVLEEFGNGIESGISLVIIASHSGYRLNHCPQKKKALAITVTVELLSLYFLQLDLVKEALHTYQLSKRGNSLRGKA